MVTILLYLWSLAALSGAGNNLTTPPTITLNDCKEWMDFTAQLQCNIHTGICDIDADLMVMCNNGHQSTKFNIRMNGVPFTDIINHRTTTNECNFQTVSSLAPKTMITQSLDKSQADQYITSIVLGVVVGLLVVLLTVVIAGWIWTWWTMKRRARITTNSRDIG